MKTELKIHLFTICWNEELLLPHFLSYYSNICEKIVVYDNFSSDNSVAICNMFAKVEVRQYYTNETIRDDKYIQIKNECWKQSRGKADWVIICDIDEFIYKPNLKEELLKSRKLYTILRCKGYNMVSQILPKEETKLLDEIKEGVRSVSFDKCIVFNPDLIEEINYDIGAHTCMPIGIVKFSEYDFLLLHYKFLNLNYILSRYKLLAARLSYFNKKHKYSYHYTFNSYKIKREFNKLISNKSKIF